MEHTFKNLKDWEFVKTKVHDISGLKDNSPENYLYQLSQGVYYPSIKISDIPNEFLK